MLKKFFQFLRGYVIITIYGKNPERFINICLRRKIQIWDAKPREGGISMCVARNDFFRVRPVASKCRVRVRIEKKCGLLHFVRLYKKRSMFLISFAACVIFLAVSSQFIWLVEINGVENSDINSIVETLDSLGIKSGALKRNIPEGMEIKQAIISETDGIAWAWVYIEGAKARVEIYEQILPPNIIDRNTPCDIVAACDGVIKHIVVKNGEEKVREGDAVRAGDVIVSGKVAVFKEGYPEEYMYVHAMATAEAYTHHVKSGDYKLCYESRIPTGKRKKVYSIELFGKLFTLPSGKLKYENYDTSERRHEFNIPFFGYTGIALDTVTYTEVDVNTEPLSVETAVEFAKNELEEKISKELMPSSTLVDEKLEYKQTDSETINVRLEMNFVENIATQQLLLDKGEEILDKQTDRNTAGD